MRLTRALVSGFLAGIVGWSSVSAQTVAVRDLWPQASAAAEAGDLESAESRVGELIVSGRATGIARFPVYAESALAIAKQAQTDGDRSLADWGLQTARRLDPASPEVEFGAASIARQRGDWAGVLRSVGAGTSNAFRNYAARLKIQVDLLIVVSIAVLAVAGLLAIVLFIRHRRRAIHDLSESLSERMSAPVALALAWAILFLPLFLTLGPIWLGLWWLAYFFPYGKRSERVSTIVVLVLLALAPLALEWGAWKSGALTSPIIRAANAATEHSYRPATLRRLRELAEVAGPEPRLLTLLASLEAQEGNEPRAMVLLKRAIESGGAIPGAHLNLGNLHFLNNDFIAAMSEYDRAAQLRPEMTVAHYNHSVAAGELYRFDLQGQKLEEAKRYDRSLVDRLLARPPAQKIVTWSLPMGDAWQLHESVSRNPLAREYFGNYSSFDPAVAAVNPVTTGSVAALILAPLFLLLRSKRGLAGDCVKCGRTFCSRCKSSRESATYCTQCIHIYLKRDGVSLDTKRNKLEEVQRWQQRNVRDRRILSAIFPGAGQMFDGMTGRGVVAAAVFACAVAIAVLAGRLVPIASPSGPVPSLLRIVAIVLAVAVWLSMFIPAWRSRVGQG